MALSCSTVSDILSEAAFKKLGEGLFLSKPQSAVSIVFTLVSGCAVLLALRPEFDQICFGSDREQHGTSICWTMNYHGRFLHGSYFLFLTPPRPPLPILPHTLTVRYTHRHTQRGKPTQKHREIHREIHTGRYTERERETHTETHTHTKRRTERDTDKEIHTERDRERHSELSVFCSILQ